MIAYEASVLRYCPDPLGGEFANVGLLLAEVSPGGGWSRVLFEVTQYSERLSEFFAFSYRRQDWTAWKRAINQNFSRLKRSFENESSLVSEFPSFDAILAAISPHSLGAFRWGVPFTGGEESLDSAFSYWMHRVVNNQIVTDDDDTVSDDVLWKQNQGLVEETLKPVLRDNRVVFDHTLGDGEVEPFRMVWRNGSVRALEVVSLTLKNGKTIKAKQQRTIGKLWGVERHVSRDIKCSILVSPPREANLMSVYSRATAELRDAPTVCEVIEPDAFPKFLSRVLAEAKPL